MGNHEPTSKALRQADFFMDNGFNLGVQHKIFNNEVRKRRMQLGFTQEQLASQCGLGKSTINSIENFRTYPNLWVAKKIAKVLQSEPDVLFPDWLAIFKPKTTSVITEHFITEPLLANSANPLLLYDPTTEYEDNFDRSLLTQVVKDQLDTLTDRERKILELRYGFNKEITLGELKRLERTTMPDSGGMTLEEVAKVFGVTRERIRQIEQRALHKLRHGKKIKQLAPLHF